jgi:hypothetical protein
MGCTAIETLMKSVMLNLSSAPLAAQSKRRKSLSPACPGRCGGVNSGLDF